MVDPLDETAIRYPSSGQLLGMAAGFLQLKGFLREGWAGPSYKTVQRLFQGERVERRNEIVQALVDSVVPSDVAMPDPIAPGVSLRTWILDVVLATLTTWDRFVGELNANSKALMLKRLAPYPYLRLATLDYAIRWGARCALAEQHPPRGPSKDHGDRDHRPDRPSHDDDLDTGFLDEDFLRQTMDACRGDLTLDQIAEAIDVSRNTLDSWRRGRSSPTHNDHIERLARALNDGDRSQSQRLALHLRMVVAAVACRRFLVEQMGAHRVEDLISTFRKVARIVRRYLQFAPVDITLPSLRDVVWHGAHAVIGAPICRHLAEHAPLAPEMQADFLILWQDWSPRLTYWAQVIGGLQNMPEALPRELNISQEQVTELAPLVESYVFDMSHFDWTPPPDTMCVRIKNPPLAAAWARNEQAERAWSSGDIDAAIAHCRRATTLAPERSVFHYALGAKLGTLAAHGATELFDEALHECHLAAQLDPTDRGPAVEIAIILSNRGSLDDADTAFAAAESLATNWSHFHRARGINYLWLARWSDAERCFRRLLDMEPSDIPARCHLAAALAHQGSARELEHIVRTIAFHGGPATTDLAFWRMAVPTKPFAQPR